MKAVVEKLHFTHRSHSFENAVLPQHFRNLQPLALDSMEPEQAVDLTLPKVEAINKRLGSLVDEFKELVYPPDYNPEGKVTKRKHTIMKVPEAKVPRPTSGHAGQVHCAHAERGWAYGLKSGLKKQELLEALTKPFQD
ncbi:X-ray repair cross-complementing protein 6 [Plecturocebus cupreus]